MSHPKPHSAPRHVVALVGWVALSFCAALTGAFFTPGEWYASLSKPTWNPPPWLFGPVWSALYLMMAVAAWRVWRCHGWHRAIMTYLLQLLLNAAWTPVFFGLRQPGWAFAVIIALWFAIWLTMRAFARLDRAAAWLLAPYAAWVTFAAVLNFSLWRLNP